MQALINNCSIIKFYTLLKCLHGIKFHSKKTKLIEFNITNFMQNYFFGYTDFNNI